MTAALYECEIVLPGGAERIAYEELDPEGTRCGACPEVGVYAAGGAAEVIASASGRPESDPWVQAVCAALRRERDWAARRGGWRRPELWLEIGAGEMFHVSPAANRDSILRHGLDWRRMGAAPGITGGHDPELPALFVCEALEEASFFLLMARAPSDVWGIQVDGMWVENGPDGWWIIPQPVPPSRLRLVGRSGAEALALLRDRRL